ncbi:PIN domain-containing protein [Halomicronema hongdechloris]|uniref:PIN domain-containing protein n=1 Tax=Halomicronema hongdechloris TaxID=1209493 RepID=UPI0009B9D1C9
MSGRFLLDTNIVIALLADEAIVKDNLAQVSEVFIPSIVIGELCYGARKSGRVEANLARVDELVRSHIAVGWVETRNPTLTGFSQYNCTVGIIFSEILANPYSTYNAHH